MHRADTGAWPAPPRAMDGGWHVRWLRMALAAGAAVVDLASLALLPASTGHREALQFEVRQAPPVFLQAPAEGAPPAAGSVTVYEAPFRSPDGAMTGIVSGSLLAVDAATAGTPGASVQRRLTDLVFHFDGKGSMVVAGGVDYPDDPVAGIADGEPQSRRIVETTGMFAGARGQIVSTRAADGSYIHAFTLER